MKIKTLIIGCLFWNTLIPVFSIKNVLILGDSHFVGHFGEYVHENLHETNKYDIFSIAISGAGSKHFTMTLKNFCCGYKIRYSCAGTHSPTEGNTKGQSDIVVLEKAGSGNNGIIGKSWKGKLPEMMLYWMPDLVVFSLGSNNVNAHQALVDIIRAYQASIPIIWIGPFKRKGNQERYKMIEKTVKENTNIHLVRSDDIIGHDTITMTHYYGKTAQKWANKVTDRMKPLLMEVLGE
jgi:hypothetical protein